MIHDAFFAVMGFTPWASLLIAALLLLRRSRLPVAARFYRAAFLILALRCALPFSAVLPAAANTAGFSTLKIEIPTVQTSAGQPADTANTITAYLTAPAADPAGETPRTADHPAAVTGTTPAADRETFRSFTAYTVQPFTDRLPFTLAQLAEAGAYIWAIGAAGAFLWRLFCWAQFSAALRRNRTLITEPALCALAKDVFGRPVKLYKTDELAGPALAGFWAPAVYLPRTELTVRQLRVIFAHEACHAKRQDIACKWLLAAAAAVCWFNPLVWAMCGAAQQDIERACDEAVLRHKDLDYCKFYGSTMLDTLQAGRRNAFSTEFTGSAKQLKTRFASMFDRRPKRPLLPVLALLLAVVVLAGSLISCTGAPAVASSGIPQPTDSAAPTAEEILQGVTYPVRSRAYHYDTADEATGQPVYRLQAADFEENAVIPASPLPEGFTERRDGNAAPGCHVQGSDLWFAAYLKDSDTEAELYLAKTRDSGSNWAGHTVQLTGLLPEGAVSAVLDYEFLNADTGYLTLQMASGELCILRTDDGGESWQLQYAGRTDFMPEADSFSDETRIVRDVRFVNETVGFASVNGYYAASPVVMQTTDSGKSWHAADFGGVLDPVFTRYRACCVVVNGAKVEIRCFTDASPSRENVTLTSDDLGESWRFGLRDWYTAAGLDGDNSAQALSTFLFPVAADGYKYTTRGFTGANDHAGIDLAGTAGTDILAAADGSVTQTDPEGLTDEGIFCEIDHGGGLVTRYAHCADLTVSVGQSVKKGQVIGHLGATGNSTDPHLHFEVLQNGTAVDPAAYLGGTNSAAFAPTTDENGNLTFRF